MVNTKKEFAAAGQLENDILKPRCSHEVAKPLGTRPWTSQRLTNYKGIYEHICRRVYKIWLRQRSYKT